LRCSISQRELGTGPVLLLGEFAHFVDRVLRKLHAAFVVFVYVC
jgi:hypothetical protein